MPAVCLVAIFATVSPGLTAPSTPLKDEFNRPLVRDAKPAKSRRTLAKPPSPKPRCPFDMAYIRGGRFGTKSIRSFCLDTTEVTVARFSEYVARLESALKTAAAPPKTGREIDVLKTSLGRVSGGLDDGRNAQCTWRTRNELSAQPINCVSLQMASEFCAYYGKRLPLGLEWQWAGRGGKKAHEYPWGGADPAPKRLNMATKIGAGRVLNVGIYPKSANGLHDMAGNVAEWVMCEPTSFRCPVRGGHFQNNDPVLFRVTYEDVSQSPDTRSEQIGFRCASDPQKRSAK